ncbi:Maf family protein [Sphingobacterium sp. UT-1RO-CII-1]|uniref:Maf family protein n=1 Tax=Sphingobacterium sp. UT-1RO-CII-1 TaxID=2995225 RepID=UPI00227C9389|nr:Maf family protein [Sphingobacterium sp. UT-1RO-CII-1]MCY4778179.1 Maf family protein [Sphingobacterium sp. UT-1RO-CII-1]
MLLIELLRNIPVILGSQSPRRKKLLEDIGVNFDVVVRETEEEILPNANAFEIVEYIACNKLKQFDGDFDTSLVITADTVVAYREDILGKPRDKQEAQYMLEALQGAEHRVLTAVAFAYQGERLSFVEETIVELFPLSSKEIEFYIDNFSPFDKAGAYGIQEWIGFVGVKSIRGSYDNVVGLPVARLYQELKNLLSNY